MVKTFRNEISWRAAFVVVFALLFEAGLCFAANWIADSHEDRAMAGCFRCLGLAILGLTILLARSWLLMRYEITQTELRVYPYLILGKNSILALNSIQSVTPLANSLVVPTCSAGALRVDFLKPNGRRSFLFVSPRERDEFLRELERRAPDLMLADDRLVRVSTPTYVN